MKKRIISALLTLCMLVTLVPAALFPASAAESVGNAGAQSSGSTADSYDDLYVGADGSKTKNGGELVVWLTGFKTLSSYNLTAGQWTNVAPGATKHATISGAWKTYEDGGIGYDLASKDTSYYISLDSALLPTDEYTLEIVASVRGLTVNGDGVTVPEATTYDNPAGISLGRFRAFFWHGKQSNNNRKLNSFVHMITEAEDTTDDNWNKCGKATDNWNGTTNIWQNDTSVITAGVTLLTNTAANKYAYTFTKNGVDATPTAATTCSITAGSAYQGKFILFRSVPATVYGVRLYTKTLTEAEMMRNRAIDLLLYVDAPFSIYSELNEEDRETFLLQVAKKSDDVTVDDLREIVSQLAAIREKEAQAREKSEYDKLYIGADGSKTENGGSLKMLLTAYETNSVVLSGASGVWYDKMGNHDASFIGSVWTLLENGGVGYDLTIHKDNTALGTYKEDPYLNIGIAALPEEDYSLEYVVRYDYLKEIDADGNVLGDYEKTFKPTTMADAIGQLKTIYERGVSTTLKGAHYSRWFISPGEGAWQTGNYLNDQMFNETSRAERDIFVQQVIRDMTVGSAETTVTFKINKNGNISKQGSFTSLGAVSTYDKATGTTLGYKYYTEPGSDSLFYLFRSTPVDVYAIRLYDAVLTAYETAYNRFIDLLAYAKVDFSLVKNLDAESFAFLVNTFSTGSFSDKASLESGLEEMIKLMKSDWSPEESLYVTDGLTVLLSSFDGFSTSARIDEGSVIWANAVTDGTYGTLIGRGWHRSEDGGLRIRDTVPQSVADAQTVSSYRKAQGNEYYLNLDYSFLPAEDYTIETVLAPEGITVEDYEGNITRYFDDHSKYGMYYERAFVLGAFRCMGMACYSHNVNGNMERRWLYQSEGGWDDFKPLPQRNHVGTDKALAALNVGQIVNYSILHDYSEEGEEKLPNSQYTVLRDNVSYMTVAIDSEMYIAKDDVKDQRFNIWRGLASTMYSVRVYDRLLTEDEKLQNRVADICYYFDLDVTMLQQALADMPDKSIVFKAFANLSFDMTKEEAQRALNDGMAGIWVQSEGVAVKGDRSDAIRFYFTLQYPSIAAMMHAGFALELGTLVNVGTHDKPRMENGAYDYRFVAFDSVSGKNEGYFLDEDTYAVTLSYIDATQDLYNEKLSVVSYVKLTAENGDEIFFYSGLGNSAYDTFTSLFSVFRYLSGSENVAANYLTDYLETTVRNCYYDEVVYFDSYANVEGGGEGTESAPYTDFNDAFDACKELLTNLAKPTNVTLYVEGGTHFVSDIAELDFGEIRYPDYRFIIEGNFEAEEAPELTTALNIPASAFKAVAGKDGLYVFEFAPDAEGNYPKFRNLYVDGMTADLSHSTPTTTAYGAFPLVSRFDRDEEGTYLKAKYYYDNDLLEAHAPSVEYAGLSERTDLIASYTKHYEWFLALYDLIAKYKDFRVSTEDFAALTVNSIRSGMGENYAAAFAKFHTELCNVKNGIGKFSDVAYTIPKVTEAADRTGVLYMQIEAVEQLRATVEARLAALKANLNNQIAEVARLEGVCAENEAAVIAADDANIEAKRLAGAANATKEDRDAYEATKLALAAAEEKLRNSQAALAEAKLYVYDATSSYKIALRGTDLEIHAHANWDYNIMNVDGIDFDDVVYYYDERHDTVETLVAVYVNMDQYAKFVLPSDNSMANRYLFLRNALEFVDEEGEYYYDVNNGLLYYYTDYEIEEFTFAYPTMDNMIVFHDAKNVTISDLTFWGVDDYTLTELGLAGAQAGSNGFSNADNQTGFSRRAAVAFYNATNVLIQDSYFHDIGGAAIYMEGRVEDTTVTGNEIEMIGDSGIRIRGHAVSNNEFSYRSGAERVTITQNYLHEIAQSIYNAPALYLASCKDVEIASNTIIGCNYSGMSIGWSWVKATWEEHEGYNLYNVNIHHNYITDFMQFLSDGGAIYMLGGNLKPDNPKLVNFIHHNFVVFSDKTGNGLGQHCTGYYFDGSSTNWSNYNNILVEQSAGADRGAKANADDRDYALYLRRKGSHFFFKQHTTTGSAWSYNIHSSDNLVFNVRSQYSKEQQKEVFHMGSDTQWQACGHKVVGTRYYSGSEKLALSNSVKSLIEETGSRMCPGEWAWLLDNEY